MEIIGHKKTLAYLLGMAPEQFPHTLLITGPVSVGKTMIALAAAARLLGCSEGQAETHPSIIRLKAGSDPKTGTPRSSIPVQMVRDVKSLFHIQSDGPLVILIERAQELQQESSNALLKIMEEPGRKLYFIILALSEDSVLQTIKSRSAHVHLSPVTDSELRAGMLARGVHETDVRGALEIGRGRPGVAIRYAEDAAYRERVISERMRFSDVRRCKTTFEVEKLIGDFFAKKDRHIEGRAELAEILEWWMAWLSASEPTHPAIAQIAKTIPLLFENMHPRLLMERIVIELVS